MVAMRQEFTSWAASICHSQILGLAGNDRFEEITKLVTPHVVLEV